MDWVLGTDYCPSREADSPSFYVDQVGEIETRKSRPPLPGSAVGFPSSIVIVSNPTCDATLLYVGMFWLVWWWVGLDAKGPAAFITPLLSRRAPLFHHALVWPGVFGASSFTCRENTRSTLAIHERKG